MDIFQTIVLSIIEGVTEFLPISSTGHLILTSRILDIEQTEFVKSFEIIIQFGAILSIVFLYFNTLIKNKIVWTKILTAFIPTAIVGLFLYKFIKSYLLGNSTITLLALFIGGVVLIILELIYKEKEHAIDKIENLSFKKSFLIGIFQSVSIIPGVSRAAASIIGGLFLGLNRKTAAEFSFLLAIPTMLAASTLDLTKSSFQFERSELLLLVTGFITSFITALIIVKWFVGFVQKNNFILFGVYRIILAILFWLLIIR